MPPAGLDFCITHAPAPMLVTDLRNPDSPCCRTASLPRGMRARRMLVRAGLRSSAFKTTVQLSGGQLIARAARNPRQWRRCYCAGVQLGQGNSAMSDSWKGRCLCGGVHYQAGGAALAQLICHCRDCQRASGSAGLPIVVVHASGFSCEGEIRPYTMRGGSGMPTTRNFCAHCGSLLFGTPHHAPEIVTIYAGTLDEPSRFRAEFAQFTSERHLLDARGTGIAQHPGKAP